MSPFGHLKCLDFDMVSGLFVDSNRLHMAKWALWKFLDSMWGSIRILFEPILFGNDLFEELKTEYSA